MLYTLAISSCCQYAAWSSEHLLSGCPVQMSNSSCCLYVACMLLCKDDLAVLMDGKWNYIQEHMIFSTKPNYTSSAMVSIAALMVTGSIPGRPHLFFLGICLPFPSYKWGLPVSDRIKFSKKMAREGGSNRGPPTSDGRRWGGRWTSLIGVGSHCQRMVQYKI